MDTIERLRAALFLEYHEAHKTANDRYSQGGQLEKAIAEVEAKVLAKVLKAMNVAIESGPAPGFLFPVAIESKDAKDRRFRGTLYLRAIPLEIDTSYTIFVTRFRVEIPEVAHENVPSIGTGPIGTFVRRDVDYVPSYVLENGAAFTAGDLVKASAVGEALTCALSDR